MKVRVRYILSCIFFVFIVQISFSQAQLIDSLHRVLLAAKKDTCEVNALNKLSEYLWKNNQFDSSLVYSTAAQQLAEKLNFKKGEAKACINKGIAYDVLGNYTRALEFGFRALTVYRQTGDTKGVAVASNNIANTYYAQSNYLKALEFYYKALATDQKAENKKEIATYLCNLGNTYTSLGNYPKALEKYLKALAISTGTGDTEAIARTLGNLGIVYNSVGNYRKALECYFNALEMDRKSTNKTQVANDLVHIGNIYVDQGNPEKALDYYFKALQLSRTIGDKAGIGNCLGNIGVIYANNNMADSALKYQLEALNIAHEIGDKDGVGVNLCGIGNIYGNKADYDKALDYYFRALPVLKDVGDQRFIISSYANIGDTYLGQKRYKLSRAFLDSALGLSFEINEKDEIPSIFLCMAKLDSAAGNPAKALENYKKYVAYRNEIVNQENVKKLARLEVGFEYERREDSLRTVQEKANIIKTAEIKRKSVITYSSVVISVLTVGLALLLINRQQMKRKKDKMLFEKNLELSEKGKDLLKLEKQRTEDELANVKLTLDNYVRSIIEKNELLEQFKTDVENLKNLKVREINEVRIEHLENLSKATILTEDDWNKFKTLFEQVYKGFFVRLKEKLPGLTQAEIRLICLTKLKLETKQMAGILGISVDTIKKTRYRLRKKLELSEQDSIDDRVASI